METTLKDGTVERETFTELAQLQQRLSERLLDESVQQVTISRLPKHYSHKTGQTFCGADEPNQASTTLLGNISCVVCLQLIVQKIAVFCAECHGLLLTPGGLKFSPPNLDGFSLEQHICRSCWG